MVVGIGVGAEAVAMGDADTGRTDRVVESCMAVRARASQLAVVLVYGGVLVRTCLAKGVLRVVIADLLPENDKEEPRGVSTRVP